MNIRWCAFKLHFFIHLIEVGERGEGGREREGEREGGRERGREREREREREGERRGTL